MNGISNLQELTATREKLRLLEDRLAENNARQDGGDHIQELSSRSLKRLINQMKEEITRFEARNSSGLKSA